MTKDDSMTIIAKTLGYLESDKPIAAYATLLEYYRKEIKKYDYK